MFPLKTKWMQPTDGQNSPFFADQWLENHFNYLEFKSVALIFFLPIIFFLQLFYVIYT